MSRLLISAAAGAAAAAAFAALPAPALAQQGNIAEIVVYGNDPCPRSTAQADARLPLVLRSINGLPGSDDTDA